MRYKEVKGHWPLRKAKEEKDALSSGSPSLAGSGVFEKQHEEEKTVGAVTTVPARTISE